MSNLNLIEQLQVQKGLTVAINVSFSTQSITLLHTIKEKERVEQDKQKEISIRLNCERKKRGKHS